jgi:hypothetical protein
MAPAATGTPAPVVDGPALNAETFTIATTCSGANCSFAVITAYLVGAPAGSNAGVQWQDPNGAWHNVDGWQGGTAQSVDGNPFQQWTVFPANFGQGPFRWVVYAPDLSVWGIGPDFNLPTSGQNQIQILRLAGQ